MKYSAIAIAMIFLFCNFSWAADSAQSLESKKEKESYSIGYQVGLSMRHDEVEVDFQKLTQGLQDAIEMKEPLLSNEECGV